MATFNKGYPNLFGGANGGENEGGQGGGSGFADVWGWSVTLDALANGRRDKWDYFTEMGVTEFLNAISYYKAKQMNEAMIQRMNNAKHGR